MSSQNRFTSDHGVHRHAQQQNQVVIPQEARRKHGIEPGASIVITNDCQWKKVDEIDVLLLQEFPVREVN
jgi:bifunctional DNA-binding transcriptional regulator/antitoxin component of YhaV-PrlF toxin-antitoxin module